MKRHRLGFTNSQIISEEVEVKPQKFQDKHTIFWLKSMEFLQWGSIRVPALPKSWQLQPSPTAATMPKTATTMPKPQFYCFMNNLCRNAKLKKIQGIQIWGLTSRIYSEWEQKTPHNILHIVRSSIHAHVP